jgi:hypothetical protein
MRALLARYGFVVRSDRDGVERARRWVTEAWRGWYRFHHVVVADRVDPAKGAQPVQPAS